MTGTRRVNAVFSHAVAAQGGGDSFLDYLCRRFPYHSPGEWRERVLDGRVLINGASAAPETPLRTGMRVQYRVEGYEEPEVPLDFREIRRSENLALVHKPQGLPVHKTGKIFVHTLANLYRREREDEAWAPLNRLDAETSGIVAFGRGPEALKRFAPTAPETRWIKLYLAAVRGTPPESGRLDQALGPKSGDPIRSRMLPNPAGKPALTVFRRLLQDPAGRALLLARPVTGRKHQIRAHFAAAGFPVIGDKTYSLEGRHYLKRIESPLDAGDLLELEAPRHLLHSWFLEIRTANGEGIQAHDPDVPETFSSIFPSMRELLRALPESGIFREMSSA